MIKKYFSLCTVFAVIMVMFSGCQKERKYNFDTDSARYRNKRQYMQLSPEDQELDTGAPRRVIVPMEADVPDILGAEKIWKIGVLVPLTGKNAIFGKQALDAMILALFDSKIKNIRLIPLDVGDTAEMATNAAKIATSLMPDIVVGPIFSEMAKVTSPILAKSNIENIVLSNDVSLAKQGSHVFGIIAENMMFAVLDFTKSIGKNNFGAILPSNAKGLVLGRQIEHMTEVLGLSNLFTEYYLNDTDYDKLGIKIQSSFQKTFYKNKEGKLYQLNIKDRVKNSKPVTDKKVIETVDSIYIDAKPQDLLKILVMLNKTGILQKDITLMVNEIKDQKQLASNPYTNGMIFSGTSEHALRQFEEHFRKTYQYEPIKVAALAYDATSTVIHIIRKYALSKEAMYRAKGFTGLFGDFRFTANHVVQRRFNIYRLRKNGSEIIQKIDTFI